MTTHHADQLPLAVELSPAPDVESALLRLASKPHSLLLDSALRDPRLGRYSFLTADPFDYITVTCDPSSGGNQNALQLLEASLARFQTTTRDDLPAFQGGAAGLLAYDLAGSLEKIPGPRCDEFALPHLAIGLYDTVLAFDHHDHRAWLISQGFPETDPARRYERAKQRIAQFQAWLHAPAAPALCLSSTTKPHSPSDLAALHPVPGPPGLTSNFSRDQYLAAVQKSIDYIHAGDIFQVNLSQRLLYPAADDALSLYLRLRQCNPAPFAAWFDLGDSQIVSASPERFVRVRRVGPASPRAQAHHKNGLHIDNLPIDELHVEARPIKGTRRRTAWAEANLFAGDDLLQSEKDRAENVMIVDLLRNDLSRVCTPDSVRVTQLCGLETYQFVQHLVSAVEGTLAPGQTAVDLVRAAFPGGSITGAPKIRAMEIIAELEPTARGPYCGSLGYFGFDGSMDLSILIRTITASRGYWQFPVGGGITAQSNPLREYEETWHKAEGLLRALI